MEKTFEIYGKEYTVKKCMTTAECDTEPQEALKVVATLESGEVSEMYVFGYDMPETQEDLADMFSDASACEPVYNYS